MTTRMDRDMGRYFLKDSIRREVDFAETDQGRMKPGPPVEKPFDAQARRVHLPPAGAWRGVKAVSVEEAIRRRQSHRRYAKDPLALDELAFLLWATQGIRQTISLGEIPVGIEMYEISGALQVEYLSGDWSWISRKRT